MNFERNRDPKKSSNIGIEKAILNIIKKRLSEAENFTPGLIYRGQIVEDVEELTGWEEVKDITSYDYPYIFKFRGIDKKTGIIKNISINIRTQNEL